MQVVKNDGKPYTITAEEWNLIQRYRKLEGVNKDTIDTLMNLFSDMAHKGKRVKGISGNRIDVDFKPGKE
jgi:hypothetical protein